MTLFFDAVNETTVVTVWSFAYHIHIVRAYSNYTINIIYHNKNFAAAHVSQLEDCHCSGVARFTV